MTTPSWLRNALLVKADVQKIVAGYDLLYNGNIEEHFTNDNYRRISEDDNKSISGYYKLNLARTTVDAPLERTKVAGIECADEKSRNILVKWWADNKLDFYSRQNHLNAYEFGNSSILLSPDENGQLQAYIHSPADVVVFYDPAKPRDKAFAMHSYIQQGTGDESTLFSTQDVPYYFVVVIYTKDVTQKWISTTALTKNRNVDPKRIDMQMVEEFKSVIPGLLPVFHFRTSLEPIGRSRLADVAGIQYAVNDTLTCLMAAVKRAGFRQRFLTFDKTNTAGDAFEGNVPSSDDVETDQYEAGPDHIMTFGGSNVNVGSFDVSNSSNFLEPINDLAGFMGKVSDTPTHYFTSGAVSPTGEAYRQGERPLNAVVEDSQGLFNASYAEVFSYVLQYYGGTDVPAEVAWKKIAADDSAFWQTQALKATRGVPDEVLLVEGGYDQETIDQWNADKANAPQPQITGGNDINSGNIPIDPQTNVVQ